MTALSSSFASSRTSFTLFGREPRSIVCPQSLAEAQEIVRGADGQSIIPWGGGCRQGLGYPPERYDIALLTSGLAQVLEYDAARQTVTAQAGVTVAQLQQALAAHGQRLPLDIARPDAQTLGGAAAAREGSLRRLSEGGMKDLLCGICVINARGERVQGAAGAGFDLPKLYCGSLGTLGLIAEVTLKVSPQPEASATMLLPLDAARNTEDVLDMLLASDLRPAFVFLVSPGAASTIVPEAEDAQYVVVGFDGSAEFASRQAEVLGVSRLADAAAAAAVRAALRDFSLRSAPMTAEFHVLSSQVGAFSRMLEWTARRCGFDAQVSSDAALGLMTAHFAPQSERSDWRVFYADLKDKADRCGGSVILTRMPDALRSADVPVWSPLLPDFALMARLKEALDPARMWNPGRFVGRL